MYTVDLQYTIAGLLELNCDAKKVVRAYCLSMKDCALRDFFNDLALLHERFVEDLTLDALNHGHHIILTGNSMRRTLRFEANKNNLKPNSILQYITNETLDAFDVFMQANKGILLHNIPESTRVSIIRQNEQLKNALESFKILVCINS